jgi:uncharacterized glyoxalase superfamily protein PhnB
MAQVKAIPEGLHTLTPQLTVEGAAEAIDFLKRAFGAEELSRAPDPSGKKIWHASLRIGNSVLFINDVFPDMGGTARTTDLWLYSENADALFKRATGAGAQVAMAMEDMFWGDRMGQLNDRWGNRWSIAQRIKEMTPDEMRKAGEAFAAAQKKK